MAKGCVRHPGRPVRHGGPADKYREDSQHGLPPLSGGREPVRSSVWEEGHGGRPHVQGAFEGTGIMQRVRKVVGGRIPDESYDYSTWEGGRNTTEMEHPDARTTPWTFRMTFLVKGVPWNCPAEGCLGRVATRTTMRVQFLHLHVLDTVVIMEEGNFPHPWCARCNMIVP